MVIATIPKFRFRSVSGSEMSKYLSFIFIALALVSTSAVSRAADEQVYILVNAPSNADVSEASAKALLRGQRRNWDSGQAATVVLPSRNSNNYDKTAEMIFQTSGAIMQRTWFRLVFGGRVNAPKYFDSDEQIIAWINEHEGAVGVVISNSEPNVSDSIQVIPSS